jgi:LysR family transcriptional regulator, hydrogen peroxide-inducible genes activator
MNLNQLRFAKAVAATESFTAAAAECFVTQPTLSTGIAQLEDELGGRLFVRTTRSVSLTPFGAHLLPYLHEVLAAQTSVVQQARAFLQPEHQLIRIGTSPLIGATTLEMMIEPFKRAHPKVDLVLREMNMQDLQRLLDAAQLDFVFGVADAAGLKRATRPTRRRAAAATTYVRTFLYDEALRYVPRGAALPAAAAKESSVSLKDIAHETYVMVPDACGLARATRALFRSQRRTLHEYSGEAMSYQVLEAWARLGIGAAILPTSKLSPDAMAASLPIIKNDKTARLTFEAVWRRIDPSAVSQNSHLANFASHLTAVVPSLMRGLNGRGLATVV